MEVVTGSVRGAGTPNLVKMQLYGTHASSDVYIIGDDNDNNGGPGFSRDSVKTYALQCEPLGSLRRIHLAKAEGSLTELGSGWFLERVVVMLPDGNRVTFPCHAWIGEPDDASGVGEYERNLIPCVKPAVMPERSSLPAPLSVRASGLSIPHPDKLKMGFKGVNRKHAGHAGEDAYFYAPGNNDVYGFGVADGVYMWREQGIDSGVFSRTLMETSQHMVEAGYSDVLKVAQIARRKAQSEGVYGSSTMCVAVLDRRWARIHSATLGDSGLMVIGATPDEPKPHIKFRTSPQEHEFGHPYQLGHHAASDRPEDAMLASVRVLPGDTLILGSDGLFDNIFDRDIAAITLRHRDAAAPAALVRELVAVAYENSRNKRAFTPYSYAASEWFDMVYDGGKPDDITVVAAFVQ